METIYQWLYNHVALCTWVVALCALLTFVFNFILKKKRKTKDKPSQNISNVHNSTINQSGRDITFNGK